MKVYMLADAKGHIDPDTSFVWSQEHACATLERAKEIIHDYCNDFAELSAWRTQVNNPEWTIHYAYMTQRNLISGDIYLRTFVIIETVIQE